VKRVEFYSKNKFEKLVHLVGFIIRIYHDAWSPERQIQMSLRDTGWDNQKWISVAQDGVKFRSHSFEPSGSASGA